MLTSGRAAADLYVGDQPAGGDAAFAAGVPAGVIVTGSGTIVGSADPHQPWVVDGTVRGDAPESPIVIGGFTIGAGSFDNVEFAGVYSPGHSPALVTVGSVIYTASNVLEMELGGLLPGSQHDKIVHTGLSAAGGTLDVVLINAFTPAAGNVFDLFDWNAGVLGSFATVNLPALNVGLSWDASDLYAGGTLAVTAVPEASPALLWSGLAVAAAGAATTRRLAVRRRRRAAAR
ncbi:MAG: hypothetical protein CMJ58_06240 [Planctomycetaceae bacterium]|nr:hypothetical protein [Planctomycetaceae bacterium]